MKAFLPYIRSSIGILICFVPGALVARWVVGNLGWDSLSAAFAAILVTMTVAFAMFVAGVALLRSLGNGR